MHAENHYLCPGFVGGDLLSRLDPVELRHRDIEDGNLRVMLGNEFDGFPLLLTSATTLKSDCCSRRRRIPDRMMVWSSARRIRICPTSYPRALSRRQSVLPEILARVEIAAFRSHGYRNGANAEFQTMLSRP